MECRDLNLKMFVWMCQPYNFEHFALLPWFLGLWSPALFQVGDLNCSISLCWLPQGVLLLMILCLSCQSDWDVSSSSLQRSCAGMGAGRRVFCLSIGPRSSLGLCEGWWQMVLPAGALPGFLSLFSLLPQGRDGTWCLWRGLGAV